MNNDTEPTSGDEPVGSTNSVDDSVQAAPEEKRKFQVKIDGEDREIDEDELVKDYQLRSSSYKRMEDASKLAKDAQPYVELVQALKKGDLKVLKKLGIPADALREFSEKELLAYIEDQDRSPAEKRAVDAERERDQLKAEREEFDKRATENQRAVAADKAAGEIDTDIRSALDGVKIPLKGNFLLVRRIAEDMYAVIEDGKKPSAKDSLTRVLKGIQKDFGEHATRLFASDPEAFLESLPAGVVDGIRKRSLKKVGSQLPIGNFVEKSTKRMSAEDEAFREYQKESFAMRG